ncbi:hypothetical protein K4H28_14535 [Deefgea tanakiae]|uniref:HEPN AbiU2-like domain-containing protein n=1 Tax=Deefgea tanakiae TaxID=2865840 RepID=A0ABX8Z4I5_9NEIS|nr:hypothetical protein [Deefgea tanakiae]QZA77481.1 hypothetical protein K4H28_14535 [Deefgea tanakiae]
MIAATVRTFAPELWSSVDYFRFFYIGTHSFNSDTTKAISGVRNHFQKALILHQLSTKLLPNLSNDEAEIQSKGYTPATNAKEFSAVLEEVFTELYSSIDCTRKIIVAIYRRTRGLPDSTRKLFHRVSDGLLGNDFPDELKHAIASADWYDELLAIRDELTHSDIGNCMIDRDTKLVTYMHTGIYRNGIPLIITDVMGKLQFLIQSINTFLEAVFHFLNSQLEITTIDQLCGIFFGRAYLRTLTIEPSIDLNSGICQSHTWFDHDVQFRCPLANSCGAYTRAKSPHQPKPN